MTIRFLLILLCFSLVSCDEPVENQTLATSGLMGFWQGIIKSVSGNQELVTDITLSLEKNKTFKLTKTRTRAEAKGTYDEFPQLKSLTLRVDDSQVEELALSGGIRDFEYQLFDGELLLSSTDSIVRLKRPQGDSEDSINKIWRCEQGPFEWQLSFVGQQFMLYLDSQEGASVFLKGTYSVEETEDDTEEQRIALFVEDAQPIMTFSELIGTLFYQGGYVNSISLTPIKEDGSALEAMECSFGESDEESD